MKILYDEKNCLRCLACVLEAENNGIIYVNGRIHLEDTIEEDWEEIISICPTGALKLSSS